MLKPSYHHVTSLWNAPPAPFVRVKYLVERLQKAENTVGTLVARTFLTEKGNTIGEVIRIENDDHAVVPKNKRK
jgi:hypothetical protein